MKPFCGHTQFLIAAILAVMSMGSVPLQAQETGFTAFLEGGYVLESGDRTRPVTEVDDGAMTANPLAPTRPDGGALRAGAAYEWEQWRIGLAYAGSWLDDGHQAKSDGVDLFPVGVLNSHILNQPQASDVSMTWDEVWRRHRMDLTAGYALPAGQGVNVLVSGGLRYAHFSRHISVDTSPLSFVELSEDRREKLWGLGPVLNISGAVRLSPEFQLVGGIGGSALFGDRDIRNEHMFIENNVLNERVEERIDGSSTFYSLDGEVGLAYSPMLSEQVGLSVILGYRMEQWWNVQDTRYDEIDSDGNILGRRGHKNGDALSHGPFLRLGVRF